MPDELLNILSNSNKDIDNQTLMDYLSGKLSDNEKHELEKSLIDNEMASDAFDGLNEFKNKKDPIAYAQQLNLNLQKQLDNKKSNRSKQWFKEMHWLVITVICIIAIALIAFFLIYKFLHS